MTFTEKNIRLQDLLLVSFVFTLDEHPISQNMGVDAGIEESAHNGYGGFIRFLFGEFFINRISYSSSDQNPT